MFSPQEGSGGSLPFGRRGRLETEIKMDQRDLEALQEIADHFHHCGDVAENSGNLAEDGRRGAELHHKGWLVEQAIRELTPDLAREFNIELAKLIGGA